MAVPTNLLQPQMASRGAKGSYEPENESVIKEFGKEMAQNINEIRLGLLPWKDPEWKLMVVRRNIRSPVNQICVRDKQPEQIHNV
ncbi:hypothetical protein SDJN03_27962, partial [Cucurbita argyrosperma subsp. sororia]